MGYVNFPFIAPTVTLDHAINQRGPQLERAVREYLAFRCNMQEIFTYPWIDDLYIEASGVETSDMLELRRRPRRRRDGFARRSSPDCSARS